MLKLISFRDKNGTTITANINHFVGVVLPSVFNPPPGGENAVIVFPGITSAVKHDEAERFLDQLREMIADPDEKKDATSSRTQA